MRFEGCTSFAIILASSSLFAQQPTPSADTPYVATLTFDVASIRESSPADSYTVGGANSPHSSLVNLTNMNVMNLLAMSYGVDWAQIVNPPEWAQKAMFNVQAKADSSGDDQLAMLNDKQAGMEKRHMMQVLLEDRFKIKVHWETKEGLVYDLVVAKSGPRMRPGGSVPPTAEELKNFGDHKIPSLYQRGDGRKGYEYLCHECAMGNLASILTSHMKAPVLDKTGLTGTYDFILQYSGSTMDDAKDDPEVWPPLMMAVPDQLGLKLQPSKGERKFLVIDHIEKPSAN